jgi:HK97 gp10 family phage protein
MADLGAWKGDEFFDRMEKALVQNLKRACIHVARECKKNVSDPFPPSSAPGDYPHRRDGELRRSITWEVDEATVTGRVGSNKAYARYLEIGTSEMEARPFLRKTLAEERDEVGAIMARPTNIEG